MYIHVKVSIYLLKQMIMSSSVPFELTMNCDDNNAVIPRRSESSIKWLVMPWQVLIATDKGVVSSVEETLSRSEDNAMKIQTCQFITNIMVQDFPAEVFLQRPTTVNVCLKHCSMKNKFFIINFQLSVFSDVISHFAVF